MLAVIRDKSVGIAAVLALLLSSIATSLVQAQTAVPIKVDAVVESASLRRAWGADQIPRIEMALAEHWRVRLSDLYHHWDFHTEDRPSYAVVTLKIAEPESRKVEIAMSAKRADGLGREELWAHVWLKPVDFDLGRRPAGKWAEQALREKSEALFGRSEEERVMGWLRAKVPLGKGGRWNSATNPDDLRVITSLPWSRFQTLKSSVFMVLCRDDDQQVQMQSEGTLDPLTYETDSGTSYDALVLKPEKISDTPFDARFASEVNDIEVQIIYLLQERDLGLDFFF